MSPTESIADGLEIQYAYSPTYSVATNATNQINKFYLNGWTVKGGYLTFLRGHDSGIPSWDSSPYSAVGDDEYIVIRGSERWNGVHKVKDAAADGTLQTYTVVHESVPVVIGSSNINFGGELADNTAIITADSGSNIWLNSLFSAGDYIFVSAGANATVDGFWKVNSVADDASTEATSGIYIRNRYFCYHSDNTITTEGEDTTIDTTLGTSTSATIYRAYRDFCYLISDVDVMDDESFDLDLPRYQANAIVYYLKAQLAEDRGDMDQREFFMREFKRQLEKGNSSKKRGPHIIQGFKGML
tara:strand:- start:32 stop:931 length:900 start_codon:yes stop_codon:yes gene_type:complete